MITLNHKHGTYKGEFLLAFLCVWLLNSVRMLSTFHILNAVCVLSTCQYQESSIIVSNIVLKSVYYKSHFTSRICQPFRSPRIFQPIRFGCGDDSYISEYFTRLFRQCMDSFRERDYLRRHLDSVIYVLGSFLYSCSVESLCN